jgi:putative transcriptional regulator
LIASHTGQLLVATPALLDPNFRRGVLLVLDHDTDGALAVVINRPSELPLEVVLPGWGAAVVEPPLLFVGGPVAADSALAVGLALGAGPDVGFKRLYGDYGLVDLDLPAESLLSDLVGVRVFSGYAGWGEGQLEAEISEGSWYVANAVPTDVLTPSPAGLWRDVLRRQPGELAFAATFPDDPNMN